jgi:hypothetical protein
MITLKKNRTPSINFHIERKVVNNVERKALKKNRTLFFLILRCLYRVLITQRHRAI